MVGATIAVALGHDPQRRAALGGGITGAGDNTPFPSRLQRKNVSLFQNAPVEGVSIMGLAARQTARGQNFRYPRDESRDR